MGLSCLNDHILALVCDTSTIINLNATGCASAILRAVPNNFFITDVVLDELGEDTRSGRNDALLVSKLVEERLVTVAEISALESGDFERLVEGNSSVTLDDGEAATIAFASERGIVALIDEKKANKLCRLQYPGLLVGSTCDVLALDCVEAELGRVKLADAAHSALTGARMRVLPQHLDWIINLIGVKRAGQCESLPKQVRDREAVGASKTG